MTQFVRTVWQELLRSLGETFSLLGGDGGRTIDLTALAVRGVVSVLILFLAWIAYGLARRGLAYALGRARAPGEVTGQLVLGLRATVSVLAFLAILAQFGVPRDVLFDLGSAAVISFFAYVSWLLLNRLVIGAVDRLGLDLSLRQLLRNVLGVTVASLAFVTVMDLFGVNVLAAVTALGVAGIAVGFAAQDTLSNFIAGITLLIERPFRLGDWIEVAGKQGRVEAIRLRTTLVTDRDNIQTVIPNHLVASDQIVNLSGGGPLRIRIPLGIAYKESAEAARALIVPILAEHEETLAGPGYEPIVMMTQLGASSVDLVALAWIAPSSIARQPRISAQLLERIKETLDDAGVEIPFPHLQLFIDEAKGLRPVLEGLRTADVNAVGPTGDASAEDR